jgi:hypothetical protein
MITSLRCIPVKVSLTLVALLSMANLGRVQSQVLWEAFNDYRPAAGTTSDNATGYDLRITGDGGVLKDIKTGADLPVSVLVEVLGDASPDDFGANSPVNPGSPADQLFGGKVVIGNDGLPGIRSSQNTSLILQFTGLDPAKRYHFRGTVSRGGGYNDRWSVFSIEGADASVNAHEDGSNNKNIITKTTFPQADLQTNQVALNTGDNKAGSLVGWDNIEPGTDGTFSVSARQYTGAAPFGNPSAASYGYGFSAIYLAGIASSGSLRLTENPQNQNVPAGTTATLKVTASSPQAITYQWQKADPGKTNFVAVTDATQATYTTPVLTPADSGAKFRCLVSSGGSQTTSGEATVLVDGLIPSLSDARGSINFNAAYLSFSEPMKLDQLAKLANYSVSGGLTISSAVAMSPTSVRLATSKQNTATRYAVTVNNIEDLAGNKVPANSTISFASFTILTNTVGVEIWNDITGSAVSDLTNNTRYLSPPDVDYATTTLSSERVVPSVPDINTYGGRFRAWLTPDASGEYEFFLRCDDQGEFRISPDDKFDAFNNPDIIADAVDTSAGDTFQETGIDQSTSLPIQLERGKKYAIQAIWKESNGTDYCQVAWRKVGDATPADQLTPIPSQFLSYYGPAQIPLAEPEITKIALQNGKVVLEWTGTTLESSDDLKTWGNETGATSPFSVTPVNKRFYRVKN